MIRIARSRSLRLAAFLIFGLTIANRAAAGPFTSLVVFGDSLSDIGNVSQATPIFPLVPKTPGPYYWNGRFSNGAVYAETLATGLGLPVLPAAPTTPTAARKRRALVFPTILS